MRQALLAADIDLTEAYRLACPAAYVREILNNDIALWPNMTNRGDGKPGSPVDHPIISFITQPREADVTRGIVAIAGRNIIAELTSESDYKLRPGMDMGEPGVQGGGGQAQGGSGCGDGLGAVPTEAENLRSALSDLDALSMLF